MGPVGESRLVPEGDVRKKNAPPAVTAGALWIAPFVSYLLSQVPLAVS